ncbi:hypothetical protein ACRXB1_31725, partial [Caballeronia sp. M23-90]
YERLKLLLLNLGHTMLAELWLAGQSAADATVLDAMRNAAWRESPFEMAYGIPLSPSFSFTLSFRVDLLLAIG